MIFSKGVFKQVQDIIDRNHASLLIDLGAEDGTSLLSRVYAHNLLNEEGSADAPYDLEGALAQQVEEAPALGPAEAQLLENLRHLIEKQRATVSASIEGLLHQANGQGLRARQLSPDLPGWLLDEGTLSELKRKLRDAGKDAFRDWERIVNTEVSNAVGLGSVDRILEDTRGRPASEVFVYRINPDDARTCKYCRKFYLDTDASPKVYRLSTLLANGSNYGKRAVDWLATTTSTHPNCRDSQLLELKPGWKVLPGGAVTYIGLDRWNDYILDKLEG